MAVTEPDRFAVVLERLARVLSNETHAEGLKPVQWEALRYLARANRFSRTPSAVTAYLGVTKGTVSQTLAALERKGLVRKSVDARDKRSLILAVTSMGERLLSRDPLSTICADAVLPPQERAAVAASLESLLLAALRRRDGRPFGACRTCRFFRADADGRARHRCGLLDEPLSETDGDQICVEHEAKRRAPRNAQMATPGST